VSLLSLFGCKPREQAKAPEPEPARDPGTFVDPFSIGSIESVTIEIRPKGIWLAPPGTFVETTVRFSKCDTTGWHKLHSRTLDEMLPKVKAFLEATR
jgi:hypothetical protein